MTTDRNQELEERVAALEATIEAMRAEVRTRRIVVEDEDGFERIVAASYGEHTDLRGGGAELRLSSRSTTDEPAATTNIILDVNDEDESATVALWGGGNHYADMSIARNQDAPNTYGEREYLAEVAVERPNNWPGMRLTHEGLVMHGMRLQQEADAYRRWCEMVDNLVIPRSLDLGPGDPENAS